MVKIYSQKFLRSFNIRNISGIEMIDTMYDNDRVTARADEFLHSLFIVLIVLL